MVFYFYKDRKNQEPDIRMNWLDWIGISIVLTLLPIFWKSVQLSNLIGFDQSLEKFASAVANVMIFAGTFFIAAGSIDGVGVGKPVFLGSSAIKLSIRIREVVPLFFGSYLIQFSILFGVFYIHISFGFVALGALYILFKKRSWIILAYLTGLTTSTGLFYAIANK